MLPHHRTRERLLTLAFATFLILALGVMGHSDYEAERMLECAQYNKSFDAARDRCISVTPLRGS